MENKSKKTQITKTKEGSMVIINNLKDGEDSINSPKIIISNIPSKKDQK